MADACVKREGEGFRKLSGIEHDFFEKRSLAPLWATNSIRLSPTPVVFAIYPSRVSPRFALPEISRWKKNPPRREYSPGNPGNREACLFLSDDLSLLPVSIPVHNWDLDLPERDNSLQSFSRGCESLNRPGRFLQFRAALINQSLHSEYNNIPDLSEKGSEGRTPVRSLVKNVKDKGRRFADKIRGHGFP